MSRHNSRLNAVVSYLSINGVNLLEGGEDKDGSLTHARLGLAEDVHAEDGLRDALMLNWKIQTKWNIFRIYLTYFHIFLSGHTPLVYLSTCIY